VKRPRLAIAQQKMHWTLEENGASIIRTLERTAQAGAAICVFPELALTGFHRQIATLATPEKTAPHLRAVAAVCAAYKIATAIGTPTFDSAGRIFNSHVFNSASGEILGEIAKAGLTPAEATFFTPGGSRPIFDIAGVRFSSVLCREVEDVQDVCAQLPAGSVDILFWPGAIRPAIDSNDTQALAAEKSAREIARRCNAYVVQANWPNSLNYPEESAFAGQSIVVDPQGEELIRLPISQAGVAIFTLGARTFGWHVESL
jgi:omega-amidase